MPNFTTSDRHLIVIEKGGEQLPDNTYGFELEFCAHDSSVFAFTHVDVATLAVTINGGKQPGGQSAEWKIETDSGNVLELVTSPIQFKTTADAYAAKDALALVMTASVSPALVSQVVINAVTFLQWAQAIGNPLLSGIRQYCYAGQLQLDIAFKDWEDVGDQLTLENVDDGINIKAAKKRWWDNLATWHDYVGATVLCRSEKDWGVGYSSQVNMPMTLAGYFLYVVTTKLPRANARLQDIVLAQGIDTIADSTLYQRVTTWFWSNIIADMANVYATGLFGVPMDVRKVDVPGMTYLQLRAEALAYLVAQKVLTGALGALSETNQLKLQTLAWQQQSTEAMVSDGPASYRDLLRSADITTTEWNEYHSSMKDLTGLWFKAAVMDVVVKEQLGAEAYIRLGDVLLAQRGQAWGQTLEAYVREMRARKWDRLWRRRDGYADDLETLNWRQLLESLQVVEAKLGAWLKGYGEILAKGGALQFQLPDRKERKFLHYAEAPPWEGRYDTMISAIQRPEGAWTYLIEHRFH